MRQRAVPPRRPDTAPGSQHSQMLAFLLLSTSCCASALAATSPITACDRTANLQSLEVPVSDLSATVTGHVVVDPDDQDDATIDALPAQVRSEVPILKLAPRVALILQDVFSTIAIETPPVNSSKQPLAVDASPKGKSPLSPVAGDASQSDLPERTDPASGLEYVDTVPRIQRQMYRTDI